MYSQILLGSDLVTEVKTPPPPFFTDKEDLLGKAVSITDDAQPLLPIPALRDIGAHTDVLLSLEDVLDHILQTDRSSILRCMLKEV